MTMAAQDGTGFAGGTHGGHTVEQLMQPGERELPGGGDRWAGF